VVEVVELEELVVMHLQIPLQEIMEDQVVMVSMLHQLLDLLLNLFMDLQMVYTQVVEVVEYNQEDLNTLEDLVAQVVVELVVIAQLVVTQLLQLVQVVEVDMPLLLEEMVLTVLCLLNYQAQQLLLHQ
jgi:hypothetical protein|tara:strand:+ start:149 stop:532 length:384 start_codon:yes stop_codon:yes gene_type:complete